MEPDKEDKFSKICDENAITIDHVRYFWTGHYDNIKRHHGKIDVKTRGNHEVFSFEKKKNNIYFVHRNNNIVVKWAEVKRIELETYGD